MRRPTRDHLRRTAKPGTFGPGLVGLLFMAVASCGPHAFDNREPPASTPLPAKPSREFGAAEVRASMWKMARGAERVNVIMRRSADPLTAEEQQEIVSVLEEMEAVAERLSRDDARDLHPVLGENIDLFRKDLALARKTASADPPNFFMAGTVAGACGYCHGAAWDKVNLRAAPIPPR